MLKIVKGFSLLELMIVVAIIGILAMIAYPSYQTHVMKSRRVEAKTGLLALAQAQEEYRGENNEYADSLTKLKEAVRIRGERTFYSFVLNRQTPLQFKLTATPATDANGNCPQCADTQCQMFTLDQSGQKAAIDGSAKATTSDCW